MHSLHDYVLKHRLSPEQQMIYLVKVAAWLQSIIVILEARFVQYTLRVYIKYHKTIICASFPRGRI